MKRSLALALAAFLDLGLVSTSFAAFAQDAYGGITNWRGGYGSTGGFQNLNPQSIAPIVEEEIAQYGQFSVTNGQNGHFLNRQNESFSARWRPPQRATLDRAAG